MTETDVKISAGKRYEVMYDERKVATQRLAEELRGRGLTVDVEIIEYVPGTYGLTQVEWTAITILATKLFDEVYDRTKQMLIERRRANKEKDGSGGRHLGTIIYGPDGEQLKSWDTRDEE